MSILQKLFRSRRKKYSPPLEKEFEVCVNCGSDTDVPTNTPIRMRTHYISGCGQLCSACFAKLYANNFDDSELLENELDTALLLRRCRRSTKSNKKHSRK